MVAKLIPVMTMERRRSGIVTLDLLNGASIDHPSQSSPEVLDLNLPPTTLQLDLPAQPPTAVLRQLKARSAHERGCKKRRLTADRCSNTTTTSLSTISSSSVKKLSRSDEGADGESYESSSMIDTLLMALAGCPRCLTYVLISKGNPSCPRCWSHIPVSVLIECKKRMRMDLSY